jgi:hypothetical protein
MRANRGRSRRMGSAGLNGGRRWLLYEVHIYMSGRGEDILDEVSLHIVGSQAKVF